MLKSAAEEVLTAENPRGCLLVNAATEFSARDPRVRELITHGAQRVALIFGAAIKQAQSEGQIAAHKNAAVLGVI